MNVWDLAKWLGITPREARGWHVTTDGNISGIAWDAQMLFADGFQAEIADRLALGYRVTDLTREFDAVTVAAVYGEWKRYGRRAWPEGSTRPPRAPLHLV